MFRGSATQRNPKRFPQHHLASLAGPFALVLISSVLTGPVSGQLTDSLKNQLVLEIRASVDRLSADSLPELSSAHETFLQRSEAAKTYVRNHSDPKSYEAWMRYLDLEPLVSAVQEQQSRTVQGRQAVALQHRLTGIAPGLELVRLRDLRNSAEQLVSAIRFDDHERSISLLGTQLDRLADRVESMDLIPTAEDAAAINAGLRILSQANQSNDLIKTMRRAFSHPNLSLHVPESTIQAAVQREVNQTTPVRDCILGTSIFGSASVRGQVQANLLPSIGEIRLMLNLQGRFSSNNVGYNGPVKLTTVGNGNVNVSRLVHINESGVTLGPASAQVSLNIQITSIQHRLRLVRRIARKRAAEQKPQADRIAYQKLKDQITERFTQETGQASSVKPPNLIAKVRPYLERLNLPEPTRLLGSTDHALFAHANFAAANQLSAVNGPPPVNESVEFAVQVHESMIENMLSPLLQGQSFNGNEIDRLLATAGLPKREKPTDQDGSASQDSFEIRFANFRPVIFESRGQTIRLGLRGSEFTQGTRSLRREMEISTTYKPVRAVDGSMFLVRDGEVEVTFPGRRRLSISQTAIRTAITEQFSKVFPETLLTKSLPVPPTVQAAAFRGRIFKSRYIDMRDGWITIGLR